MYFTDKMQNHHGGLILWNGHVYGCSNPDVLTCIEYKTGEVKWNNVIGDTIHGSVLVHDNMLYAGSVDRNVYALRLAP